jgi:hypothetical protein
MGREIVGALWCPVLSAAGALIEGLEKFAEQAGFSAARTFAARPAQNRGPGGAGNARLHSIVPDWLGEAGSSIGQTLRSISDFGVQKLQTELHNMSLDVYILNDK